MKLYKLRPVVIIVSILFSGIFMNSCKKSQDIAEDARLIINLDVIKTTFSFKFIDAKTGLLAGTGNDKVQITLDGADKAQVIDILGTYSDDYKYVAANGFFTCGLVNTIHPSPGNPIEFTLLLSLDGYLNTSVAVRAYDALDYIYEVKLVRKDELPDGVISVQDNSGSASAGAIDNDIIISTAAVPSTNTKATLSLPKGAILKDAAGNFLNGALTVELTYFNNMDEASLSSYPGGLKVEIEGVTELKTLFSAGMVVVEIKDASGLMAVQIENGSASVSVEIPQNTFNTSTSGTIQQGDNINLYSYNTNTGKWEFVIQASIGEDSGVYSVTSQISHFSSYRWSWAWDIMCRQGAGLQFQSASYPCNCLYTKSSIREKLTGNNLIIGEEYHYNCMGESHKFCDVPAGLSLGVDVSTYCSSNYKSREPEYLFSDLCIAETREVWIDEINPTTFITADVSAKCKNSPYIIVKPTMGGWYKKHEDDCWRWTHMFGGIVNICDVEVGSTINVGFYYDGTWEQLNLFVEEGEDYYEIILLTPDICNNLNY